MTLTSNYGNFNNEWEGGFFDSRGKLHEELEFFSGRCIYGDTSFILNPGFEKFINKNGQSMAEKGIKITFPNNVIQELIGLRNSPKVGEQADQALKQLEYLDKSGVVAFTKKTTDNYPIAQLMLSLIIKNRTKDSIVIITCNKKISHDVLMQNQIKSYNGHHIYCLNIAPNGFLYNHDDDMHTYCCYGTLTI